MINAVVAIVLSFVLPNRGADEIKPGDFADGVTLPPHVQQPEPIL